MSLGESKGGLPPDSCTEDEAQCLDDMERCIKEFHDNSRCAGLPVSVTEVGYDTIDALASPCKLPMPDFMHRSMLRIAMT